MLAISYVNTAVNTGLDDTPALSTQHKRFLVSTRVPGQGDMYRTYEHTTRDTTINQNGLNMRRLLIRLPSSGRQETGCLQNHGCHVGSIMHKFLEDNAASTRSVTPLWTDWGGSVAFSSWYNKRIDHQMRCNLNDSESNFLQAAKAYTPRYGGMSRNKKKNSMYVEGN